MGEKFTLLLSMTNTNVKQTGLFQADCRHTQLTTTQIPKAVKESLTSVLSEVGIP